MGDEHSSSSAAVAKTRKKLATDRPQPNELPPLQGPDLALEKPRLVAAAGELLDGSALSPEDLVERATALTAMTAAVRALREYDQALAHYWRLVVAGAGFEPATSGL